MKYVIGDIHGEVSKLKLLLNFIKRFDNSPIFIFLGDYLDKGEDPLATLSYLTKISQDTECSFLTGNHEYAWMNLEDDLKTNEKYLLRYGGITTIKSAGCENVLQARDKILNDYSSFFDQLIKYWHDDSFVAVHSGIDPEDYDVKLSDIPLKRLLFNRYSFLKHKRYFRDYYRVIFGHTGFYHPYVDEYKVGVDTAACFLPNQPLTAFCVDTESFLDSNCTKYTIANDMFGICPNIPRVDPWRMK
ncbi:MAG: metallophosphoesterase [Bacteroidota bacterium]